MSSDPEKLSSDKAYADKAYADHDSVAVDDIALDDHSHGFTPEQQRGIIRRVDRRLVVTVGLMYCVSLMDRTNMSNATIAGMREELFLTGNRYVSRPPIRLAAGY